MDENARAMLAIAESGSISEAARHLHVTQPALSQRLKQLEGKMGTALFDRQSAPLAPTYAGEIYLDWARKAVDQEERMCREVAAVTQMERRRLQVGTSRPRGNGILPDVVDRFYREVPGCTVFLSDAGKPDSHDRLFATGALDCAVLTPVVPNSPAVAGEALCRERTLLVAGRGTPIASVDEGGAYPVADPRVLAEHPFIMPPHTARYYQIVRSTADTAGVKLQTQFHSCDSEMTFEMVSRGLGISLVPSSFVYGRWYDSLSIYELRGFANETVLYYNRPAVGVPSSDERAFVRILREWLGAHPELAV